MRNVLIQTIGELEAFCERAATQDVIAVDTEFLRERTYYPRLCLVQVGTATEQVAIDVLKIPDLGSLAALMVDPTITKVFHACSQDIEILAHVLGRVPTPVFDTQVAAAFLGLRMQIGYGALVEHYCGVRLAKADSLTDWSRRPLDADQLRYAEDDVRYLPSIHETMVAELVGRDRLTWVLPEIQALVEKSATPRDPEDAYLHVRRLNSLSNRQLAVLRSVAAWRERKAQHRDVPRKWICSDEVLVEVSRSTPGTPQRLRRIRGTAQMSEKDVDGLLMAIKRGRDCPPARYPAPQRRGHGSQETESVIDLLAAMVRVIAEDADIAPALLATRDDLHDLVLDRPGARLKEGWRAEVAGRPLGMLLAGEAGLTVKGGRVELF